MDRIFDICSGSKKTAVIGHGCQPLSILKAAGFVDMQGSVNGALSGTGKYFGLWAKPQTSPTDAWNALVEFAEQQVESADQQ